MNLRRLSHFLICAALLALAAFSQPVRSPSCPGCILTVGNIPGPMVGGSIYCEFLWVPVVEESGLCLESDVIAIDYVCQKRYPCEVEGTIWIENVSGVDLLYSVNGGPPQPLPSGAQVSEPVDQDLVCGTDFDIDITNQGGAPVAKFFADCSDCPLLPIE